MEFSGTALDEYPSFRTFTAISKIPRTELGRVRSFRASCEIPVQKTILHEMTGRADALEYLQVAGLSLYSSTTLPLELDERFLSGGASNLRYFEPIAITLPWSSQLFKSPSLARIKSFEAKPGPIDGFLGFLKHSPQLEVLEIVRLPWRFEDELRPFKYPLINMPSLRKLSLGSSEWKSMCAALFSICMPLDVLEESQVVTLCRSPMESYEDFRGVYVDALVGLFGGIIAPEEVEFCQEGDFS